MLLMLMNVTSNPMKKGIRQQVHKQKLVSKVCNLLQRTNQIGHDKGVSRTHASKNLLMTIPWNGKGKRHHTMWIFEYRKVECLYMLIELSSPRKVKYRCKCCDVLHECIEMSACDIMDD